MAAMDLPSACPARALFAWVFGISVILWLFSFMNVRMPSNQTRDSFMYPLLRPVAPKVMNVATVWMPKSLEAGRKFKKEQLQTTP